MALSSELILKLLTAIENDRLVFLCGAGLSIPSPSYLLSAVAVANICYDRRQPIENLPADLRGDIAKLAGHFYARGDFKNVFIPLVPWNEFVGQPNKGHAAIADFLISRAALAALSANFDSLIERWAEERKISMQGALNGQQAVTFGADHSPLIKFHGCMHKEREQTLWTTAQLGEPDIQARVVSLSEWMNLYLPGKSIVVVGFWTDWGYLNSVLANALAVQNASSVVVIDPKPSADLQASAPDLWAKLNALSNAFEHVQASGADVLEEIRTAHSKAWGRKFYALGQPLLLAAGAALPAAATPDTLSCEELYALRQDAEGVPYNRAAELKIPHQGAAESAFTHMLLLNAGAAQRGAWFEHNGRTIRVVNGTGHALADVRESYKEPPTIPQSEIVVCAGALDFGAPAKLFSSGYGASTVRPAPGGGASWLTLAQARIDLGI